MKKFILFLVGIIALMVLLSNIFPLVFLGLSIWLLYVIFKQFLKSDSTSGKIGWVVLGLLVLSIAFSNMYAVIGIVAVFVLYFVYKSWNEEEPVGEEPTDDDDPFKNFERQWADINN